MYIYIYTWYIWYHKSYIGTIINYIICGSLSGIMLVKLVFRGTGVSQLSARAARNDNSWRSTQQSQRNSPERHRLFGGEKTPTATFLFFVQLDVLPWIDFTMCGEMHWTHQETLNLIYKDICLTLSICSNEIYTCKTGSCLG